MKSVKTSTLKWLLVGALSAPALPLYAASTVEVEANDTFATGQVIPSGIFTIATNANLQDDSFPTASISGDIDIAGGNQNDIDFYCFTVASGVNLFLDIDGGQNMGNSVDTELALFDPSGTLVAYNDDTGSGAGGAGSTSGLDAFIGQYTTTVAGRYCVAVTSYSNEPNSIFGVGVTTASLSVGGSSVSGAGVDTTFTNTGGNTGDYTLHISVSSIGGATPVPAIGGLGILAMLGGLLALARRRLLRH